ncbi:flagellar biosynthetic protein FliR [Natronospira proteinivora]|uniref:Flagellar biosynthetic protein FliR n=1 Tax=Natronospira proteinivora TaxID=1807133 RepID=A0ABT1G577_9GAMM|nr:flagellar biosynthetic protein FliR [Natronospira proteinivora]MCP1726448.1 flagellar biosynthetic protein FliR [Natronospira proteinivora]
MLSFTAAEISGLIGQYYWPFTRIAGMIMVAPIFATAFIPMQVRVLLAVALTAAVAPILGPVPAVEVLSFQGLVITVQQILIGAMLGFMVQMVFDAVVIAGQIIAMSMGLGFAFMVDAQRGVSVPIVGQFFLIMATLFYLSMNGHLIIIEVLVDSFRSMPVGTSGVVRDDFWAVAMFGAEMFKGAVQIALPAVVALQTVLVAFGVMSRAAPTMNLFAVGFPVAMTLGFVILMVALPYMQPAIMGLLQTAFDTARNIFAGG